MKLPALSIRDPVTQKPYAIGSYRTTVPPIQLEHEHLAKMARASTAVVSALRRILYEDLDGDAGRVASYLNLEGGADWAALLLGSGRFDVGSTRCDMIESGGQWKVFEVNVANAGGWLIPSILENGQFNAHAWSIDTAGILFQHLLDQALSRGLSKEGDPVLLGLVVSGSSSEFSDEFLALCEKSLKLMRAAHPHSKSLEIQFVRWEEITVLDKEVSWRGRRLHLLFETEVIECSSRLLATEAAERGNVLLVPGPASQIFNDKRLFALLSQSVDESSRSSDLWPLKSIVPWTRCVCDGQVIHAGKTVSLRTLALEAQSQWVLKKALSAGGEGVFIGHATPPAIWGRLVDQALDEGDWVLQQWTSPDAHPCGGTDHGRKAHFVWGAFVIGGAFAGGFARCLDAEGYQTAESRSAPLNQYAMLHSQNSDERVSTFPICWRGGNDLSADSASGQGEDHLTMNALPSALFLQHGVICASDDSSDDSARAIASTLLELGSVADACVVRNRSEPNVYTAAVALARKEPGNMLLERVSEKLPHLKTQLALCVVTNIPRRSDGSVDLELLRQAIEPRAEGVAVQTSAGQSPKSSALSLLEGGALVDVIPDGGLGEVLRRAAAQPAERGIRFLDVEGEVDRLSYRELYHLAGKVAAGLREMGLSLGSHAIIAVEAKREFLLAFWGCALAGVVPVPCAVPSDITSADGLKLRAAWELLEMPPIIMARADDSGPGSVGKAVPPSAHLLQVEDLIILGAPPAVPRNVDDLALMLLTSGSTGKPKLVMQTHRTLLAYCAASSRHNNFDSSDVSLNWFPFDHVGGLVMFHLRDVWLGCEQIHAPTAAVLARPLRWLNWLDQYRVSITWSPNFGFNLINQQEDEIRAGNWDLSSLKFILNGGEAIVASQARKFLALLAPHKLSGDVMHPSWGMSETCSGVVYSDTFPAEPAAGEAPYVRVGKPVPGFDLRVVDATGRIVPEGEAGELEVRGESVTPGYYRNKIANSESFSTDGWFRTGDRASVTNGELAITGRLKEVIIINGRNYGSAEIEAVAEAVPGVQPTFVAAVDVREANATTDRLAVVFVPTAEYRSKHSEVTREIRRQLMSRFQCASPLVIAVEPLDIPKTSAGKIRRGEIRAKLQQRLSQAAETSGGGQGVPPHSAATVARVSWRPKRAFARLDAIPVPSLVVVGSPANLGAVRLALKGLSVHPRYVTGQAMDDLKSEDRVIDLNDEIQWGLLVSELVANGKTKQEILFLLSEPGTAGASQIMLRQTQGGLHSLQSLVRSLSRHRLSGTFRLRVVANMKSATRDPAGGAELGSVSAWLQSATAEMPWLSSQLIVLPGPLEGEEARSLLLTELGALELEQEVAHTEAGRCVVGVIPVPPGPPKRRIERGGLYLLAGGLGGVGRALAEHLLKQFDAKLLIIGRTRAQDWNRETRNDFDALAKSGSVTYHAVNVSDSGGVEAACEAAERQWGQPLRGVFHLAGVLGEKRVREQDFSEVETVLEPKVSGTQSLLRVMEARKPGLLVFFSSVNGVFGGAGVAAHATASAYQNRFAQQTPSVSGHDVFSIAWSFWEGRGQSRGRGDAELARARGYLGLSTEHALELFDFILSQRPGLWVAGVDVNDPSLAWRSVQLPVCLEHVPNGRAMDVPTRKAPTGERPDRMMTNVEVSSRLKEVWCEVLQLDSVREDENLFDLGGHSLIVPRMLEQINEKLGVNMKAVELFRFATIRSLAGRVGELLSQSRGAVAADGGIFHEQL